MREPHSRTGKRVEQVEVTDEPHERYRGYDPWTGERLETGIPILSSTKAGNVVEKSVTRNVTKCPECKVPARYSESDEPICPDCGIICANGDSILMERIRVDAQAAGRLDGTKEGK